MLDKSSGKLLVGLPQNMPSPSTQTSQPFIGISPEPTPAVNIIQIDNVAGKTRSIGGVHGLKPDSVKPRQPAKCRDPEVSVLSLSKGEGTVIRHAAIRVPDFDEIIILGR